MKTVLITGSQGALGSAVIAHLKQMGNYRVVATGRQPVVGCQQSDQSYIQLDVRDREQMFSIIQSTQPSLVLHLAATFINNFEEAYAIHVDATRHLLEAVQLSGSRTRVLLVGSAAEYGIVRAEENPIDEDRFQNPVSIYGLTKAWQTQLARFYAILGVDVVVARIFNLDGPGLSDRLFIGRLQKQISEVLAGRRSNISLGSLDAIRDYVSTDEAAYQMLAIAEHGEVGRTYHVASGVPVMMREIFLRQLAFNNLDVSILQESLELSSHTGYSVPVIFANITRTLELIKLRELYVP